jgi:hypothetical protein
MSILTYNHRSITGTSFDDLPPPDDSRPKPVAHFLSNSFSAEEHGHPGVRDTVMGSDGVERDVVMTLETGSDTACSSKMALDVGLSKA